MRAGFSWRSVSDQFRSSATAGSVWLNCGLSIETSGQPFELKVANKPIC